MKMLTHYENLPNAVQGEEVTEAVEIFSLPCFRPFQSGKLISGIVGFKEKVSTEFFQGGNFLLQLPDVYSAS